MSSPSAAQETLNLALSETPQPQMSESSTSASTTGSLSSTSVSSALVSPGGGSVSAVTTPPASTSIANSGPMAPTVIPGGGSISAVTTPPASTSIANSGSMAPTVIPGGGSISPVTSPPASTSIANSGSMAPTVIPASSVQCPSTPGSAHGSINEPLQDPIRAKFVSPANYVASSPTFSYNVFPQVNSAAGRPQQGPSMSVLRVTPPMSASALQPPVPGHFGNRPSFSYNVFPHANASSPSGQQFRLAIGTSQVQLHGPKLTPPMTAASLQPPVPGQTMRPSPTIPGSFTQSIPRPIGPVSTSSNFSFGGNVQPTKKDALEKKLTPKDGTSNDVAPEAGLPSEESFSSQPVKISSSLPSSCSSDSMQSPIPSSSSMPTSASTALSPRPGMSVISGTTGPSSVPHSGMRPTSDLQSAIRPTPTPADPSPSSLRPAMPPSAAPSNRTPVLMPPPQNIQHQIYMPYRSLHSVPHNPQAPWFHPPLAGGLQRAPFSPYPGVIPPPFPMSVHTLSLPLTSLNVQSPGVSTGAPTDVPTAAASSASKLTADSLPSVIENDNQVDDLHNSGETTKNEETDAWTAHKTESGTTYYYNSITRVSTYDKPSSFKGEPEKVTEQPTPVSWEKVAGTSWTLVTMNDGKKYYYDTENKVSSWQVPSEVADMKKNQENDSLEGNTANEDTGAIKDNVSAPLNLSAPAVHTGGRDSMAVRSTGGQASSSALDLIKKKLQDAGAPVTSTPISPSTTPTFENNGSRVVEAVTKGQQSMDGKDKVKDANGEGNVSDSSSDSDDTERGPTKEDCIVQFKEMLKERGVAPFSKWDKELPKIVFDPRFKAVPSYSARRSIFEHFVRTRAEEERKEKRAAQKAAIDGFKQLLEEASEDIGHKTDYQIFKRKWGKDPRFEALDRKERELLLNEKIFLVKKAAEEKNQVMRTAVVTSFKTMLRENRDITTSSRWSKVKDSLRSDPRYKSVKHDEREVLFNEYLSELKAAEDEAEQAAKAKRDEHDKLKERERETRKRKEREEQEMERVRLKVRRKEVISSYQALLVETIKDPKASWTECKPKLEKDPQGRGTNPDLNEADAEKLFRDHVKDLFERCAREYRSLLAEVITMEAAAQVTKDGKNVLNSWTEAKRLLKSDPRYSKMPRKERESLWSRYADDMTRKQKAAADPKEKPDRDEKDKLPSDFSRRSPRRLHGRR